MKRQKAIRKEIKVKGIGIHTGKESELVFKPAAKDSGINFVRIDLPGKPLIQATVANVIEKSLKLRRTSLGTGLAQVHTVEHLLSALFGLGIDNITIEVSAEEIPALDGAALNFYKVLTRAGIVELEAPKRTFTVKEPLWLGEDDAFLTVFPDENFRISYTLSYPELSLHQYIDFTVTEQTFLQELAPCKTFCLKGEVEKLKAQGLGQGARQENTIVVGEKGSVPKGESIFTDDFARHKVLDLIGDFCLLAPDFKAHVVAIKSGHPLNIKLLQKLDKAGQKSELVSLKIPQTALKDMIPPFDIEKIRQVLPHRYPFLLVDRVVEFEEGKHVVGIKNVTINEQFFTGHFPGRAVMPGVLILEAMAQTAGILMLSRKENQGKLAFFMSMDQVKFRRTVVPGDQLLLKVDVVRIKSRTIQIRGRAFVQDKVTAEAEMMFSLLPKIS